MRVFPRKKFNKDLFKIHDIAVISPDESPQLFTTLFGFLDVDRKITDNIHPNVAFNCEIELKINYGSDSRSSGNYKLKFFVPKIKCVLHSILSVEMNRDRVLNAVIFV